MTGSTEASLRVEVLGPQHGKNSFESGAEPLDRYLRLQAGQDARKNIAAPFVLVMPDGAIAGYYTLSSTAVSVGEWPAQTVRKLPRYPLIPATLLGRLAVDRRQHGRGYGRYLLADALLRSLRSEIASFAVVVDAKDENARRFYERESFLPFPDQPMRLFRPMADIAELFE
ncbi:GNAT family N-acetyltransferase [Mesorhizobium sp. MSK_1335]|uniref:GNAT family N-acetyltransferase n=1 Tax=Mesorhizobium montanum TaxID=3072323 RepID=A0ABU4ZN02_9HYPH|nr:GNAT family N-acetyltransferase [Mesorhizobium sp. MSK_1335]MDX8525699.1 GNAT family N-acetyltransferase [Mesorhizobium sp. MSK_1335]